LCKISSLEFVGNTETLRENPLQPGFLIRNAIFSMKG